VKLKVIFFVTVMHAMFPLIAQDIQFSQFYASPLFLNPAFAGSAHNTRMSFHERIQWPGLEAKYLTSLFSFDTYFAKQKSGFGLMMLHDVQGSRILKSSEVALQYSYELPISNYFTVRAGLQAGIVSRNVNYAGMIFPDQLNSNGVAGPTDVLYLQGKKSITLISLLELLFIQIISGLAFLRTI
jgi:type IX secretion system PorP/SprF family membrane protein